MLNLQNYGSSSEEEIDDNNVELGQNNEKLLNHLKPVDPKLSVANKIVVCATPAVMPTVSTLSIVSMISQ